MKITHQPKLIDFLQNESQKDYNSIRNNIYAHNDNYIPMEKWFTIVAGFSGNFVRKCIKEYSISKEDLLLDPFVGTGTSALVSMCEGVNSIGVDINPFNNLVAKVKTNYNINRKELDNHIQIIEKRLSLLDNTPSEYIWEEVPTISIKDHLSSIWSRRKRMDDLEDNRPRMPHLDQWMSPKILDKVMKLKNELTEKNQKENLKPLTDFSNVAFGSILVQISNMQLAGPKICYRRKKGKRILCVDGPVYNTFLTKLRNMQKDLTYLPKKKKFPKPKLLLGDARKVGNLVKENVDIAITSPPYLNEVDYLDNTRLELYFLDFLKNEKDLRVKKEQMIRANSKYLFKSNKDYPDNIPNLDAFRDILDITSKINEKWKDKKWGWDHPRLVAEYFIDMTQHLEGIANRLNDNSYYLIMIGDSAIGNIHIPTDEILAKISIEVGFNETSISPFRWRGSSRHKVKLRESLVILRT